MLGGGELVSRIPDLQLAGRPNVNPRGATNLLDEERMHH